MGEVDEQRILAYAVLPGEGSDLFEDLLRKVLLRQLVRAEDEQSTDVAAGGDAEISVEKTWNADSALPRY